MDDEGQRSMLHIFYLNIMTTLFPYHSTYIENINFFFSIDK